MVLEVADKTAFHTFMNDNSAAIAASPMSVYVKFDKRGLSGVPTFLDWDGCQGSVSVLLQK